MMDSKIIQPICGIAASLCKSDAWKNVQKCPFVLQNIYACGFYKIEHQFELSINTISVIYELIPVPYFCTNNKNVSLDMCAYFCVNPC